MNFSRFSTLTGAVNGPGALLGLRFLVGAPEAAFYCGACVVLITSVYDFTHLHAELCLSMFMLSRWFTKREMAVRGALFYVGLLGSNAFGPLVAAGILGNM